MNILQEFKKSVNNYSKKNLVINNGESLSFIEADKISDTLASHLLKINTARKPVVIRGHKENIFIPIIIACIKTRCPYIPIESSLPQVRIQNIIDDTEADIFFDLSEEIADIEVKTTIREDDILNLQNTERKPAIVNYNEEDTAYILFTSGSTGRPKGVPISYKALSIFVENLMGSQWLGYKMADYSPNEIYLNQVSYSFDVSIMALYPALCSGGTLFSVSNEDSIDLKKLFEKLSTSSITTWISTPSFAELSLADESFNEKLLPTLKNFHFCGEALSTSLCQNLYKSFSKSKIFNFYGPTEATVAVTALEITKEILDINKSLPIGKTEPQSYLFLSDKNNNIITDETKGELIISGDILSSGYYNDIDKSNESFIEFTIDNKNIRGYKTGDLCSYNNNLFYYHGRLDFQIKLHGHRIELLDIEENLKKIKKVRDAVVIPVHENSIVKYLEAFVLMSEKDCKIKLKTIVSLKKELSILIPRYMIPRKFNLLNSFPLNTSGKVDRKKLQL